MRACLVCAWLGVFECAGNCVLCKMSFSNVTPASILHITEIPAHSMSGNVLVCVYLSVLVCVSCAKWMQAYFLRNSTLCSNTIVRACMHVSTCMCMYMYMYIFLPPALLLCPLPPNVPPPLPPCFPPFSLPFLFCFPQYLIQGNTQSPRALHAPLPSCQQRKLGRVAMCCSVLQCVEACGFPEYLIEG